MSILLARLDSIGGTVVPISDSSPSSTRRLVAADRPLSLRLVLCCVPLAKASSPSSLLSPRYLRYLHTQSSFSSQTPLLKCSILVREDWCFHRRRRAGPYIKHVSTAVITVHVIVVPSDCVLLAIVGHLDLTPWQAGSAVVGRRCAGDDLPESAIANSSVVEGATFAGLASLGSATLLQRLERQRSHLLVRASGAAFTATADGQCGFVRRGW